MNRRAATLLVNGALLVISAIVVFPLLWMASVSFMQSGAASTFPPPLLPAHATLANYRQLFVSAGMGRYLANSLAIAAAITLLSLAPDPDNRQVLISGEANSYGSIMKYISALEGHDIFGYVYLRNHDIKKDDPEKAVRFTLLANWQDKP